MWKTFEEFISSFRRIGSVDHFSFDNDRHIELARESYEAGYSPLDLAVEWPSMLRREANNSPWMKQRLLNPQQRRGKPLNIFSRKK